MPVNLFKSNKKRLLLAFLLLIGLAATSYISIRFYLYAKSLAINRLEVRKKKQAWEELEKNIRSLLVNFRGDCGIVIRDLKYGWEFSFNADKLIPSASLAKIPVMAACFYAQEEGAIDLNQLLSLKRKVRVLGSGRLKNMPYGTNFRAGDLIELMIAESDNTAANMLIELLGFDYLNIFLNNFGFKNTNIVRGMMDFKSRSKGRENFTTAQDISFILDKIYRGEFLNKYISGECLEILKKQKMKDRIPAKLPVATAVAHKTGLEKGVCHDAGIVFTPGGDFLITVLVRHRNKTAHAAKELISEIALKVYNYTMGIN